MLSELERELINRYQGGFPITRRPFAVVAEELATDEASVIAAIDRLLEAGYLSRFGPLYNAERMGGSVTLAAMQVPEGDFDQVTEQVNAFPEVAHNYQREHDLNMWFVVACEQPERIAEVLWEIERVTGLTVYNFPKQQEFFIGLQLEV